MTRVHKNTSKLLTYSMRVKLRYCAWVTFNCVLILLL